MGPLDRISLDPNVRFGKVRRLFDEQLSPRPRDWASYIESAPVASDAFMTDVEDLPVQERGD